MKVFLENFSKKDTLKIMEEVKELEPVLTKEESEFWFPNTIKVEDVISVLKNGDVVLPCDDDISQRKA